MTLNARLFFYFLLIWIPIVYPTISFAQLNTPSAEPIGDEEIDGFSVIKAGESIQKKIEDNLFIRVELSKATCFIGEPVLVTYQLLTRIHAKSTVSTTPSFSGCSVLEMTTDDLKATTVLITGKKYRSYVIRKVQLLPLIEGLLTLGTAKISTDIQFYCDSGKFYSPVFHHLLLSSPLQTIVVKPLPNLDSMNYLFDGAIGQFFMTTKVKKSVDTVNGTNALEIGITGRGNFASVTCPSIHWPSGIQAFEMQSSDVLNKFNFPVLGVKKFTIPFTCNQQGESVIPSIEFIFFDADSQRYQRVQTDTIHVKVKPPVAFHPTQEDIIIEEEQDYIWVIIPALAIAFTVGLIIFLKASPPLTNVEDQWPEAISHFDYAPANNPTSEATISTYENSIVAIEKLHLASNVFLAAKQIAQTMLEDHAQNWDKAKLQEVIACCNAVLYAQAIMEPSFVISLLEAIVNTKG